VRSEAYLAGAVKKIAIGLHSRFDPQAFMAFSSFVVKKGF
jgi:hypothetical protein